MMKFSYMILISFIATNSALAESLFTAIHAKDNQEVFIALKDESGKNPSPVISIMNVTTFKKENLTLPKKLKSREVGALYYHHSTLYVLSQWTIGTGDMPMLHAFDTEKKQWSFLGEFSCVSMEKIAFDNKKAILTCADDKVSELAVPKLQVALLKEIQLPQSDVSSVEAGTLSLEGLKYYWRKMKSSGGKNKKIKLLSASEFF